MVFVREVGRTLADSPTREVSLAPPTCFGPYGFPLPTNGLQEGRLGVYLDDGLFPNLALLSIPVPAADIADSLAALKWQRSVVDVPHLILTWLGYCWGVGVPHSPLADGIGIPGAALMEAAFAATRLRSHAGAREPLELSGGDLAGGNLVARLLSAHPGRARHQGRVLLEARAGARRALRRIAGDHDPGAGGEASKQTAEEVTSFNPEQGVRLGCLRGHAASGIPVPSRLSDHLWSVQTGKVRPLIVYFR